MKIRERSMTVSRGAKVQPRQYESTDFFVSMSADIDHDEDGNPVQDSRKVYAELVKRVNSAISMQLEEAGFDPDLYLVCQDVDSGEDYS